MLFHAILISQFLVQFFFSFAPKKQCHWSMHIFSLLVLYSAVGETRHDTMPPASRFLCLCADFRPAVLTDKSLNGWISIPNGNRDLLNSDCVFGMVDNVHLKILKKKQRISS